MEQLPLRNPLSESVDRAWPFLVTETGSVTTAEILSLTAAAKTYLGRANIPHGSSVAMYAANSARYLAVALACFDLQIPLVLLNVRQSQSALAMQLCDANCVLLISDQKTELKIESTKTLDEVCNTETQADGYQANEWNLDTTALVVFTSGSEGKAKGVVHSLRSLFSAAQRSNQVTGFSESASWLLSLPLYHLGGFQIFMRALLAQGQLVCLPVQSATSLAALLRERPVDFLSLVPTQLAELLECTSAEFLAERSKRILLAGAPSSPALIEQIKNSDFTVLSCYGMTETAAHCTCLPAPYDRNAVHTVGSPLPGTSIRIIDEAGHTVPAGTSGTICITSGQLGKGYLIDGKLEPFAAEFITADQGFFNESGLLTITDRIDRIFISGGENISANEIEQIILESKLVSEAAVVPVAHQRWGMRPVLFACLLTDVSEAAFNQYLTSSLSALQCPEQIFYEQTLPRTTIDKIDYQQLKKRAENVAV